MSTKEVTNENGLTDIVTEPFSYAIAILLAMNKLPGKHIYQGTVSAAEIAKRRAKGKRAKQARKINRLTDYR